MIIRQATEADIDALVEMGRRFRANTRYAELLPESCESIRALVEMFVRDEGKVTFVADQDGGLLGMLGLLLHVHFVSGQLMAGEVAWWVEPEARGAGLRLLRAAERWAREHGAVMLQMIAPTEDVERIYLARHYTKVETTYQVAL